MYNNFDMTNNTPLILTFVGMPGAGKDTCVHYVSEKYHLPDIYFGGMVYDEVKRRGLDIVKDETSVREDMRAQEGPAVLAKRVAQKIHQYRQAGQNQVVLNGLYSWSEYKYLAQEFGDEFITIAVTAPRKVRWQRVVERKDARRTYTLEQIKNREIAEIEKLEKGGPIAYADYTLANTTDAESLYRNLDTLIKSLQK